MHNMEPKIFNINNPESWGELRDPSLCLDNRALTLSKESMYINYGNITLNFHVIDSAVDECGTFYMLVKTLEENESIENKKEIRLVLFDMDSRAYTYMNDIELKDARSIGVSEQNIYIAFESNHNIRCYARANYQLRWEKNVTFSDDSMSPIASLKVDKNDIIYISLQDNPAKTYAFDFKDISPEPINLKIPNIINNLFISHDNKLYGVRQNGDTYFLQTDIFSQGIPLPLSKDSSDSAKPEENKIQFVAGKNHDIHRIYDKNKIETIKEEFRFKHSATYISRVFDSTFPDCQWHRIILDNDIIDHTGTITADTDENTRIEVSFFASNNNFEPNGTGHNIDWSSPLINPVDALMLEAKGRYICFKIELFSDDQRRHAPCINSFAIEFPHHSYLSHLPAVYQEDAEAKDFLGRYLSLFEAFLGKTEKNIHSVTSYIDIQSTPDEFLPWLAQWLSIGYDENWSKDKLRELIKQAPLLYKMRGTKRGLEKLLNIYLGKREVKFISESGSLVKDEYRTFEDTSVIIRENFRAQKSNGLELLNITVSDNNNDNDYIKLTCVNDLYLYLSSGDNLKIEIANQRLYGEVCSISKTTIDTGEINLRIIKKICETGMMIDKINITKILPEEVLYGDNPYSFHVLLRPFGIDPGEVKTKLTAISKLVDREKPAHTEACIHFLYPVIQLGLPTYLGINTVLSEPVYAVVGEGLLSKDTILSDREGSGQSEVRGRISIDTKLT